MQAFAEGSLNNALGGSGPVNRNLDFDTIHGRGTEGYSDYNATQLPHLRGGDAMQAVQRRPVPQQRPMPRREQSRTQDAAYSQERPPPQDTFTNGPQHGRKPVESMLIFDPKKPNINPYDQETAGLGASTFLEGAPAPRSALVRRDSELEAAATTPPAAPEVSAANAPVGGIQRKKSLANRLRGLSKPRPPQGSYYATEGFTSHDARYMFENGQAMASYSMIIEPTSPPRYVQSAGGRSKMSEMTPFFEEEADAPPVPSKAPAADADQAMFSSMRRTRTESNPHKGLTRVTTNEQTTPEKEGKPSGGGLLGRVKSMKGGRRPRPTGGST